MAKSAQTNIADKEKDVQRAIIDYLEWRGYLVVKFNNVGIRKPNGKYIPPRRKGVSDIIACSPAGRYIAIEVKKSDGRTSPEQIKFLTEVVEHQGLAMVARSVVDVERFIGRYEMYGLPEEETNLNHLYGSDEPERDKHVPQ